MEGPSQPAQIVPPGYGRKHQHATWMTAQPAPAGKDIGRINQPPTIFFQFSPTFSNKVLLHVEQVAGIDLMTTPLALCSGRRLTTTLSNLQYSFEKFWEVFKVEEKQLETSKAQGTCQLLQTSPNHNHFSYHLRIVCTMLS